MLENIKDEEARSPLHPLYHNKGGEIFGEFIDRLRSEGCTEYGTVTCGKSDLDVLTKKFMTHLNNKGCS